MKIHVRNILLSYTLLNFAHRACFCCLCVLLLPLKFHISIFFFIFFIDIFGKRISFDCLPFLFTLLCSIFYKNDLVFQCVGHCSCEHSCALAFALHVYFSSISIEIHKLYFVRFGVQYF